MLQDGVHLGATAVLFVDYPTHFSSPATIHHRGSGTIELDCDLNIGEPMDWVRLFLI
jgi:hypothetical protein